MMIHGHCERATDAVESVFGEGVEVGRLRVRTLCAFRRCLYRETSIGVRPLVELCRDDVFMSPVGFTVGYHRLPSNFHLSIPAFTCFSCEPRSGAVGWLSLSVGPVQRCSAQLCSSHTHTPSIKLDIIHGCMSIMVSFDFDDFGS